MIGGRGTPTQVWKNYGGRINTGPGLAELSRFAAALLQELYADFVDTETDPGLFDIALDSRGGVHFTYREVGTHVIYLYPYPGPWYYAFLPTVYR